MNWFVREIWHADDDSEWAKQLEKVLDELQERGDEVVAVTSHPHKDGKKSGIRYVLFCRVGG